MKTEIFDNTGSVRVTAFGGIAEAYVDLFKVSVD